MRAKTKQFIEFGLKINFSPCKPYISPFAFIGTTMQRNAEVNETQYSRREVQKIVGFLV